MANVKAQIDISVTDHASVPTKAAAAALKTLTQADLQAANATKVLAAASLEQANAAIAAGGSATQLAKAELSAANASKRLARAELMAAKASMSLAAGAKNAATATSQIAPAAATAAKATRGITQAQKLQGLGMAQNINLVSELAMGFGNMSPVTRGLGLAFATAGNNSFALASSLGPMGVIIGTLVGVIPGLIGMFHALGEESEDAAGSMDQARRSFSSMIDAQRSARQSMEGSRNLLEGEASVEDIDDAIAVARQVGSAARRRESDIVRARGGSGSNTDSTFNRQLFNAFRESESFQSGVVPSLADVQAFADAMPQEHGGPRRLVTDPGIALEGLRELQSARTRSFDEGAADRDASSGSVAAAERIARLEERRAVNAERERREALEADAQTATSDVGIAQAEFDRQLNSSGISPRRAQRLRASLSAAQGGHDAEFRSDDLEALGASRPAVEAAALMVRRQREVAARSNEELRARELERIRDRQEAQIDGTTRNLPGIGERAVGNGVRDGLASTIVRAIQSDAEAAERAREPGRIEIVLQNAAGDRLGSASVAEGESSRLELDADGAGSDGLGPI